MIILYGKGKAMQSLSELLVFLQYNVVLMDDGDSDDAVLSQAMYIVVTPGIKPSHDIYMSYPDRCVSELSLYGLLKNDRSRWSHITTYGITGTNGKSTTCSLLYQGLTYIYADDVRHHIYSGGNSEMPLSAILLQIAQTHNPSYIYHIVIECSSFMLRHLHDVWQFDYGVLLSLAVDHLDRHGSMDDYAHAKRNIINHAIHGYVSDSVNFGYIGGNIFHPYVGCVNPNLPGIHNQSNLGAVHAILSSIYPGYDEHILMKLVGVPHRIQTMGVVDGITIIDDGICSSTHAQYAALRTMISPVLLIAGGYDKGNDYTDTVAVYRDHVLYMLGYGQCGETFAVYAQEAGVTHSIYTGFDGIFDHALAIAKKNDLSVILFSPGAASFDLFANVYARIGEWERQVKMYL